MLMPPYGPGAWHIVYTNEAIDLVLVCTLPDGTFDPTPNETGTTLTFHYKNGRVRIIPWANIRFAEWVPD